jgi:hypothetical protein
VEPRLVPNGTAERVRKEGIVIVHDPHTEEKKI